MHLLFTQTTKSWKMLMNNKFKAQSVNRKSYRKFTLSWFSVTCFKHVGLLWPISALDRKQVRGYIVFCYGMVLFNFTHIVQGYFIGTPNYGLIHCGILTPCGNIDLGQHWLRYLLAAWCRQAITWTNADFSLVRFCGIHLSAILQQVPKLLFHQPWLVIRTFHHQGRCSRGGHLCNKHNEEKYSSSYK